MNCIVQGILQAQILEWVAIPFSRGSSQPRDGTQVSCIVSGFFTKPNYQRLKKKEISIFNNSLALIIVVFNMQKSSYGLDQWLSTGRYTLSSS